MMNPTIVLLSIAALNIANAEAATPMATQRPNIEQLAHACAGCHGTLGHSLAPTPSLALLSSADFVSAMRAFKSGQRTSSVMNRIAAAYTDDDFIAMAHFFKQSK